MIVFKNLTKKYRDVIAVSDLSLEIEDGEIFGLLGPNGAGKTTVILRISTVLKPTSGDATVNSFSINTQSHRVREIIGIASQEAVLDPRLTVAQNLAFHAEACGIPKATGNDRIKEELQCGRWKLHVFALSLEVSHSEHSAVGQTDVLDGDQFPSFIT